MKEELIDMLKGEGFAVKEVNDHTLLADRGVFNFGTFYLKVRLRDSTFELKVNEQVGESNLFHYQQFKGVQALKELLHANGVYREHVLEYNPEFERVWNQTINTIIGRQAQPPKRPRSLPDLPQPGFTSVYDNTLYGILFFFAALVLVIFFKLLCS